MTDLHDILGDEVEVAAAGARARLGPVIAALLVGGMLLGLLVSVILVGLSMLTRDPEPAGKLCGGAASCAVPFVGTGAFE